jgi:regulatory protein
MSPKAELSPLELCREKALSLLERRPHSRRELTLKLVKRDFPRALVDRLLDDFERVGLLDDLAFARLYVEMKLGSNNPVGRRKLQQELGKRGIARELVDQVIEEQLDEHDGDESRELDLALQAGRRKLRSFRGPLERQKKRERLYRFLAGRGFPSSVCAEVLSLLSADLDGEQ